jgi:hypothetical protein
MNGFFLPFCHLTIMSFCTQGLLGVAESAFRKAKENLLPCEKLLGMADDWEIV